MDQDTSLAADVAAERVIRMDTPALLCSVFIDSCSARIAQSRTSSICGGNSLLNCRSAPPAVLPEPSRQILYLPAGGGRHPVTECAVRAIAAKWSWAEQAELRSRRKKDLRLEIGSERTVPDRVEKGRSLKS